MIKIKFHWISLVTAILFSLYTSGQDRDNYSLLWEVENPLSKTKSYVFGTMHLSDPRVFEFSDAVYTAMQGAETFAVEIHPDSLASESLYDLYKVTDVSRYKRLLGNDKYKSLDSLVMQATGMPLDSLEFNSIDRLEALLRPDVSTEEDNQTFLDMFLYTVAVSSQKEIKGLEPVEDQLTDTNLLSDQELKEMLLYFLEDNEKVYRNEFESMVDIYYRGDIDEIYEKMKQFDSNEDTQLISRNKVMVSSIEQITSSKNLFAAVGAAHLPGENGILQLLRDKGFKVTKKEAVFSQPNMDLFEQSSLDNWIDYENKEAGYRVRVPSKIKTIREQIKGIPSYGVDVVNVVTVLHLSVKTPENAKDDIDAYLDAMLERYKSKKEGMEFELTSNNDNGREYRSLTATNDDMLSRVDIYSFGDYTYLFTADYRYKDYSKKGAALFFNSIEFFEPEAYKLEWAPLVNKKGAFKVDFPIDFKDMVKEMANPLDASSIFKIKLVQAINKEDKEQYIVRYNDFPVGYFLEDTKLTTDEYVKELQAKNIEIIDRKETTYNGFEACELEINYGGLYHSRVLLFYRGNRAYLLLCQSLDPKKKISKDNRIFNSFQLAEYEPIAYQEMEFNKKIKFKFPKERKVVIDSSDSNPADILFTKEVVGLDENSGNVFTVSQSKFGDYFKCDDRDQYLLEFGNLLTEEDSVLQTNTFTDGNNTGLEYILSKSNKSLQEKFRVFYGGQSVFYISTVQEASHINSTNTNEFFNSFKVEDNNDFDVASSKSNLILDDLGSDDPDRFDKAMIGLNYYSFEKSDSDRLVKMMNKSYSNDSLYYGAKGLLILSASLNQDTNNIADFKKLYLGNSNEQIKALIIETLPNFKNSKAGDLYFELLKHKIPDVASLNMELSYLSYDHDSLFDIATYGDRIWQLMDQEILKNNSLYYFNRKLDEDPQALTFLEARKDKLLESFKMDAATAIDQIEDNSGAYVLNQLNPYFQLMDTLNLLDNTSQELIEKIIISDQEEYARLTAFEFYLSKVSQPDFKIVQQFIKPLYYRFEGMEKLAQQGMSSKIPKKYLKDQEFGELSVFNSLYEYDSNMQKKYLGTVKEDGEEYLVYQFNYTNSDDETNYIALAKKNKIDVQSLEMFNVWLSGEGFENGNWKPLALKSIQDWKDDDY